MLSSMLFPETKKKVEDYLKMYPERGVTAYRLAPSPTGHLHIGHLGMAIMCKMLSKQEGGVFYLRIEDTDQKREVDGATSKIIQTLNRFGIEIDEGPNKPGKYGPYVQSKRTQIYHTFAKRLVEEGKAYPCFCTEKRLEQIREDQTKKKQNTGYYGEYIACNKLTHEQARNRIENGEKWVLRFNTDWTENPERIIWKDLIKTFVILLSKTMFTLTESCTCIVTGRRGIDRDSPLCKRTMSRVLIRNTALSTPGTKKQAH